MSVGSLYQYFPSKEALVLEVTRRHLERMLSSMEAKLIERMNDPVEEVAPVLVRELIAAHGLDPKLHKVLLEEVPHADKLATMREKDRRLTQLICAYLTLHREEVALDDLELGAYVLVKAAEALTHAAVIDRPELLGNGALEAQIVRLVLSYVRPSAAVPGARPKRLRASARA